MPILNSCKVENFAFTTISMKLNPKREMDVMRKKQWMIALNLRTLIREYENTVDCGHNPWCGFNIHFYLTSIFMASTNFLHSCNKKSKFIQKLHLFCKTFPNFTWPQFKNQKKERQQHTRFHRFWMHVFDIGWPIYMHFYYLMHFIFCKAACNECKWR